MSTNEEKRTSAPPAGRPLVRDRVRSITTDDEATIAWARRHLSDGVEIEAQSHDVCGEVESGT